MHVDTGKISLIQIEPNGERAAQIDGNPKVMPRPGQYLQARNPNEPEAVLGCSLYLVGMPSSMDGGSNPSLVSLAPIPRTWHPGTALELRGPLGRGFNLPAVNRLALAALGGSVSRLLPLVQSALDGNADIAIFSAAPLPQLPPAIEIQPISSLPETASWADFLALDLPIEKLPSLRKTLGLEPHDYLPCPAQALITIPMPCATVGECGVCAVPLRRKGYALACKDGPVFNLNQLKW
jgi:NAD(P)H-flavin reductase